MRVVIIACALYLNSFFLPSNTVHVCAHESLTPQIPLPAQTPNQSPSVLSWLLGVQLRLFTS